MWTFVIGDIITNTVRVLVILVVGGIVVAALIFVVGDLGPAF